VILAIDTENTTHNKGNPFDKRNINVCISWALEDGTCGVFFHDDKEGREDFERLLRESTTIVGFNLKYDLHWLRREGYSFAGKRVWCCQAGEFVLGRQLSPYPSLGESAVSYNLGTKISVIEDEYWSKGIQTTEIPRDILAEYAIQDVVLTLGIYREQQSRVKDSNRTLFSLLMQDLLVLEEMEWNGLYFDKTTCLSKAADAQGRIDALQQSLGIFHSVPNFNWASNDHLSALLYGGSIVEWKRVPDGVYKTGAKKGEIKYRKEEVVHKLPRRYNPIRGSALAKEGCWSVEEGYLKKLQGSRELIDGILQIKELKKLVSTYLLGLPKLHEEMHFEDNYIHGQFSQVVAKTGRLASSKPNLQNISGDALDIFTTRY
jgi:DNA polymerase I-like protein with 3'-5' exonuclease and polymerase domains